MVGLEVLEGKEWKTKSATPNFNIHPLNHIPFSCLTRLINFLAYVILHII